jgi:putative hydrolase of the HAD superfamily
MYNESPENGIEGIVIDAVGTLIEPQPKVADVYVEAAHRQGVELDGVEVRARFHRHFRNDELDEIRGPMVTDESIELRRWRRIVAAVLPEIPDPDRGFAELWAHFTRPDSWRCFDDVAPALRALAASRIPVRIGSNFDSRLRNVVAGLPEIAALRDDLIISSEVGFRKPHPAFFEAVCVSLGLPASRVLCVGDDLENDVLGARRSGLKGVLLDRSKQPARDVPHVTDLLALTSSLDHDAARSAGEF